MVVWQYHIDLHPIPRVPSTDEIIWILRGTCVAQVWPDSGWTWVKPAPGGGFGMWIRWLQAGH